MARDDVKTPRKHFIDSVSSGGLDVAGKQLMIERVNDVYDNPDLNSDTLWVFRANRCIEEFSWMQVAQQTLDIYRSVCG